MGRCTCSKDAQITCIVHPTEVSLKQRIAELEAELEVYKDLERRYVAARYEYMNENLRLSLDYISAVGQTQMHLDENERLREALSVANRRLERSHYIAAQAGIEKALAAIGEKDE